tara:strand:- start:255 stop:686 length:432 start_codon:yes stop_codon:yes gene_type:complete
LNTIIKIDLSQRELQKSVEKIIFLTSYFPYKFFRSLIFIVEYKLWRITLNQKDRTEFDLIHNKIDHITQSIEDLKVEMETAHQKTDESLSFIKENLFNPHEGLWAETKLNSQFRKDSQKWRGVIGTGFVGLLFKHIWDMFKGV